MRIHHGDGTLNRDDGPKRAINLTLNAKVLDSARELGMNISQTVDALLAEEVRKRYWANWNEENREAIANYNQRIEREGLVMGKYRTFMKDR
jgi:antitoxin CcdA